MFSRRILIAAYLLTLILMLSFTGGCANDSYPNNPKAGYGILDLTRWQPGNNLVRLDGQWEFYWNQLLEPGELNDNKAKKTEYINIPGAWNGYIINERKLPGDGYATYKLAFITEESGKLGIKMPRIFTSYKLWVNGEVIASAGMIGKSREAMTPQYLPQVAFFEAQQGKNEIVVQVANFYHRSGGILESLVLGNEKQILDLRYKSIACDLFLFSGLMIIGAYHLALFFFRKKDRSPLYFGLFCILLGIRTLVVGERFFIYLFPLFSWEAAHKIQTLTFYLGMPLIVMFFKSIFPRDFSPKIVKTAQVVGVAFGCLVLFTPAKIFTVANPIYQVFTILIIVYLIYALIKTLYKMETGTVFIVVGALALIITALNDIVFLSILMSDNGLIFLRSVVKSGNLSSFGQLFFVFTHSLFLALKFSNAFKKEEILTGELREMNANLDQLVNERTRALENSRKKIAHQKAQLEKSNQALQLLSLTDQLTKLWNRRHFDETLLIEWRRGLRYQRPVALIILDIDNFKAYNDYYGHIAGDECLVKVAGALKKFFNRASDLAARYGGEEFVIIMPDIGKDDAINIAFNLCKTIEDLKIPHKRSRVNGYITVSIGVTSMIPSYDLSPQNLLLAADKALYQSKAAGRNHVKFLM